MRGNCTLYPSGLNTLIQRRYDHSLAFVATTDSFLKTLPLHELTKKHQRFCWNDNCQRFFGDLKNKLIGAPIFSHTSYDRPFLLYTDASNNIIAALLSNLGSNTGNPLAFASPVMTRTEGDYSTKKREALAVVQAVKFFRSYLMGIPFIFWTDHANLQWLFRQNAEGMAYRLIEVLQEFDFQVAHRPGEKPGNADALSRQTKREPNWQEAREKQQLDLVRYP